MQIAILVEQMRREGYELMVSRPEVIFRRDADGNLLEPIENLYVEIPNDNVGDVMQSLAARKGEVVKGETSHKHSQPGRRQRHSVGGTIEDESRARDRVHRLRRVRRGHAKIAAFAQTHPRRDCTQTCYGRGRSVWLIKS